MIQKHFDTPEGQARLLFHAAYITVVFPSAMDEDAVSVPWDKLNDVEWLAEAFGHSTVRVFKPIVENLGRVFANKHIYEALL
jgi:hypothetical protein